MALEFISSGCLMAGSRRIVAQGLIVHVKIGGVKSEAVNATIKPESCCIEYGILNVTIMQI